MRFCDKLLSLRKMKRYSQEQLADLLGISRQSVSKWESGQAMPELGKIIQISNLFSVPVDDLVRDERELVRESGQDIAFVKPTYSQEPVLKMENVASEEEIRKNILEMKDTIQQISKSVNAPAGFEYKSRVSIFGIPLVHIHFGKLFHVGDFPQSVSMPSAVLPWGYTLLWGFPFLQGPQSERRKQKDSTRCCLATKTGVYQWYRTSFSPIIRRCPGGSPGLWPGSSDDESCISKELTFSFVSVIILVTV